jgi:6-phosphogluconolactonase
VNPEIKIFPDADALSSAAAAEFVRSAQEAARAKGAFTVALSGGSTPRALYSRLASDPALRAQVPWEKINFFWGDERHVPPDHPDSNFRMASEAMISRAPVSPAQIWRIKGELPEANDAASDYEQRLREFFHLADGQLPRFDLVLLGMGPDGHTASLFPGTKALHETRRLVVANWIGKFYAQRITLTAPVLNNAACVMFLVQGEDKAPALKAVLEGPFEPEQLPAQLIRPSSGNVIWLVDSSASHMLSWEKK